MKKIVGRLSTANYKVQRKAPCKYKSSKTIQHNSNTNTHYNNNHNHNHNHTHSDIVIDRNGEVKKAVGFSAKLKGMLPDIDLKKLDDVKYLDINLEPKKAKVDLPDVTVKKAVGFSAKLKGMLPDIDLKKRNVKKNNADVDKVKKPVGFLLNSKECFLISFSRSIPQETRCLLNLLILIPIIMLNKKLKSKCLRE